MASSQEMHVEKKRISWGEREEMVLLDLWAERADDLRRAKRNNHIFVEISKEMGSKFTAEEIHVKIRNMTKKYREENKNMESSEGSPSAWKHFEAVHRILGHTPANSEETCDSFSTAKTEPIGQKDIVEMSNELRSKILNHTYRIRKITGRQSKVFDVFGRIIDEDGREIENYVACKECLKVFRFINSSSNLVKHKCYASKKTDQATPVYANVDPEAIQSLQNAILEWNIESLRPFEIVEDSNLQKLITFFISMGAKYGENVDIDDLLPQAADVAKRIERMYRDALLGLKDELNSTRNVGYALTADVWNIKYIHESFLFVTIHFIENGELFHRFLGMETMDNQEYTSADVKEAIKDLVSEFDLTLNNGDIIVTNNNEKMVEAFSTNNRISCINYLLDSALEEALNITPDISEICDNSGTLYNFLSEIDTFEDAAANVLSTRWNRTYNMLSFLITNWDKVVETCQTDEKSMEGLNLSHITALVDVLKPFKESFKALHDEKCITLHLVIVHVHRLRKLCVKSQYDSDIIKKFKVNLLASFDKFVLGNMTVLHKLALYLFPPANKMISFTQIEKELVRSECKKLMKLFIDEDTDEGLEGAQSTIQIDDKDPLTEFLEDFDELPSTSTVTKSITSSELFSDFVAPSECVSSADEKVLNEMRLYEEAIVSLQGDFDLLQWWHTHQPQYPLLYKVSCKILAAPAGSMIVEKVILKARSLIYESRGANSDSDLVNETLFLHFNRDQKENPRDVTMDTTI